MDEMIRNKIVAAVVIVGVACLIFFTIIYPPRRGELLRLKNEYTELEKEMDIARKNLKGFTVLQTEYDSLITIWEEIKLLLPEEKDIPNLLKDIAMVGRQCGVEILQFKPQNPVPQILYAEIPINFSLRGSYHQLGRFLSEIANLPRLLKVRQLVLSSYRKNGAENVTLQASFVLLVYTLTEDTIQVTEK